MKTAYLGLGSNLGDRWRYLAKAIERLRADKNIELRQISSVYETTPVDLTEQPDFLNMVTAIATVYAPRELLRACLNIEASLGRQRREHWGPRTIDIDLLWYEGVIWKDKLLTLPHPRMHERGFVLTPLAEIAPNLHLGKETVGKLAAKFGQKGLRKSGPLKKLILATP